MVVAQLEIEIVARYVAVCCLKDTKRLVVYAASLFYYL